MLFRSSRSTLEADPKAYPDGYSAFKYAEKMLDLGDFIGVSGEPFYTQKWELTVFVEEFIPLTKALRPLPEKWS